MSNTTILYKAFNKTFSLPYYMCSDQFDDCPQMNSSYVSSYVPSCTSHTTKIYKTFNKTMCLSCNMFSGHQQGCPQFVSSLVTSMLSNDEMYKCCSDSTLNDEMYSQSCCNSMYQNVRSSCHYDLNMNINNNILTNDPLSESVVNLSSMSLTPDMLSVLNFCPTPGEPDINELRHDLDKFHVSLRRDLFFNKTVPTNNPNDSNISNITMNSQDFGPDPDDPFDHRNFRNKSNWCPKGPTNLESLITFNEAQLTKYKPMAPSNHNLTRGEKLALADLSHKIQIVIKPADKGSAVVVQDRDDYIREGMRQLNNPNFYIETPEDLTHKHNLEINSLVDELEQNGEIHKKCAEYLTNAQPRTSQLYLLPKIHKKQNPVPGRPIVSANNSPTERISEFVDYFLKPIVKTTKSFVKDTTDFINKIEAIPPLKQNALLCTVDVTSLYTNIPNTEGILASASYLNQERRGHHHPSNANLTRILDYVLTKNNFDFNQKHYLQVGGTAMGTRVAPSFANLFMANFEDKYVYTYPTQPSTWLRYIDDIFLIWEHSRSELDTFLTHLNTCHHSIKFTSEISDAQINFLDTTVKLDANNKLYTDLFCKSTDSHNYLRFDSAHPSHCKNSLPHSQFMRVRRICSRLEDYDRNAIMLGKHFLRRGYPSEKIQEALITNRRADRSKLLTISTDKSAETKNDNLFVINTHVPGENPLKNIIEQNWPILGRTNTTSSLHGKKIIFGKRRNKNLRDILVSAKLPDPSKTSKDEPLHKCITRKCRYCPKMDLSGSIISHTTKRSYLTKQYASCKSNNLIYCMTCKVCNKQYVGQTKNTIIKRFSKHFDNIRLKKQDDPIGRHFSSPGHNGITDVIIHALDFISAPKDSPPGQQLRDELERKWMHRLQTISPLGLNTVD